MQTKEQFMDRHFGIRCINGFYEGNNQWKCKIQIISVSEKRRTRFSNDCRKTKTKAITPTDHNRSRERPEPITIPGNHL